MSTSIANGRVKRWIEFFFTHIFFPLAFIVIVVSLYPAREKFEIGSDEGINLMKAMLVQRGYSLYTDIWSDQPPLFTHLLATVLGTFGNRVEVARFVMLLFSSLLLWAAFQITRLIWGISSAVVVMVFIFLLPHFLPLSVAVMIGIPAIALALLSLLALIMWHRQRKSLWLALSAVALGLSVLTKLITGFLAPIFVVGILVGEYAYIKGAFTWWKLLRPAVVWASIFTVFTISLGLLLVGPSNIAQLLVVHLKARQVEQYRRQVFVSINFHLRTSIPFFIAALAGILISVRSKYWLALYLAAWMAIAYGLLYFHRPAWEHHALLITIPAAILAGYPGVKAIDWMREAIRARGPMSIDKVLELMVLLSIFLVLFTFRSYDATRSLTANPVEETADLAIGPNQDRVLRRMARYAQKTNWVVTDVPMYAFRTGVPVPPNLAVLSQKRVNSGLLTQWQVIDTVDEFKPEQVVLGRFKFLALERYLKKDYHLLYSDNEVKLYIRNDIYSGQSGGISLKSNAAIIYFNHQRSF
jgi:hypothetical protein